MFFRAALFGTLLLGTLHAPGAEGALRWTSVALPLYLLCAVGLWARERFATLPGWLAPWTFLLDIGVAVSAAYALPGRSADFFVAFFLIILSSTLLRKPKVSFLVAAAAAAAYLATTDSSDPGRWMKLALLGLAPFFSTFMATYVRTIEDPYESKLAWLERLALAGRGLSAVLHEVKTPLGTVVLSAANIRRKLARGEDVEAQLSLIESEARRASDILADFLEFTKPAELELVPMALREPLDQALAALSPRFEELGVKVAREARAAARVRGSARHLVSVFANLLDNAAKAMPSGGTITVVEEERGGRARVSFRDTGLGIAPERLAGLFEPHADAGGYGLGLSISRWIVEKHGGELTLSSDGPGRGALAVVELPLLKS